MKITKRHSKIKLFAVITVILSALGFITLSDMLPSSDEQSTTTQDTASDLQKNVGLKEYGIKSAKTKILITGETFWGRLYEQRRLNGEENALEFPFSGLNSYNKDGYNTWITHLECPITDRDVSFQDQWNAIALNCRPEFLPEFAKWFEIANIGHNHIFDIDGEYGYNETKKYLNQYGIQHFGHFYPSEHSEACEVVTVSIDVVFDDESIKEEQLPIAMCGYNGVFNLPTQEDIDVIKRYSNKFFTIVMPQMGTEYVNYSDQIKRSTYRAMVDAGADLIAASHPHAVQETEVYKNKLIVYSMGNFIFDQQDSEITQSHVAIDIEISFNTEEQINALSSWLDLDDCNQQKDSCAKQVAEISKNIGLPAVKYELIPGTQNNLVQSKANESYDINRILRIAKWPETKMNLK